MNNKKHIVNVELMGWKNVKISPEPTDHHSPTNGSLCGTYRVLTDKTIHIDFGHGRSIKIILDANQCDLGIEVENNYYYNTEEERWII